jgi:hypothetical protein
MNWKRLLAYITGSVDHALLLRNEYLVTENRILCRQIKGRLPLSDGERKTLAEIGKQLGKQALWECHKWRPLSQFPVTIVTSRPLSVSKALPIIKFLLSEDCHRVIRRSAASRPRPPLPPSAAVPRRSRPVSSSTPVNVGFDVADLRPTLPTPQP